MFLLLTFLTIALGTWLGWAFRQTWTFPKSLQQIETLWASNVSAEEILHRTRKIALATGEVGFRLHLLAASAHLAMDNRHKALVESRRAHMARMPFFYRWPLAFFLQWENRLSPNLHAGIAHWLKKRLPHNGWLNHHFISQKLRSTSQDISVWESFIFLLPQIEEDPVLLETILEASLKCLREANEHPQLGHQEWSPVVPFLFDETLRILLERHGSARINWDRTPPAIFLLGQKRFNDVIAIVRTIAPSQRPAPLCEAEVIALRRSGDMRSAENALERSIWDHPASFRLWMERFHSAMATQKFDMGLESLDMARSIFPEPVPDFLKERLWEWKLNRAEYALWIEQMPSKALKFLEEIPEPIRSSNPHLLMQATLALGQYEESLRHAESFLTRQPGHLDVMLIQAECMAGMEAWEALLPFLEQLPDGAKSRPAYWHLMGLCQVQSRNFQEAREHLERAAQMEARNLRYVLDAGHGCLDAGEYLRSEQHWRQALRLSPTNEEALVQLAKVKRMQQDHESAKRLLRECLLHHPDSNMAQRLLAELEAH